MLKLDIFNKEIQSSESRFDSVNIFTSGEQVNFDLLPTVNGTGILLSGQGGGGLPSQFIFGETSAPISILQQNNSPFQTIDIISDGVQLTRGTYGVLYNPNDQSEGAQNPTNTAWNIDGWGDLSDLATRGYIDLDQIDGGGNFGNVVVGAELIMHDTSTDKYYKFLFSHWQQGAGNNPNYRGFSYTRTELGYKQQVDQLVDFTTRPIVNGTGVLLNGDFNIVAPKTGDFILKQSYAQWIYGGYGAIGALSKWDAVQSSDYYLQFDLKFMGGTINNQIIPKSNSIIGTGTHVDVNTIYYRDDGYGMQPANYVDFINNILISYGLGSRIYAQNASERFILNYATSEQFQFLFKEVGGGGYLNNPQYYQIGAIHPYVIYDQISEIDFAHGLTVGDTKYWTNL